MNSLAAAPTVPVTPVSSKATPTAADLPHANEDPSSSNLVSTAPTTSITEATSSSHTEHTDYDAARSLYTKLSNLPFPNPGVHAISDADKGRLLSSTLKRYVASKPLVEKSSTGKRGNCRFDPELTKQHKWLMTGDLGSYCIVCKLFCTVFSKPRTKSYFTSLPFLGYSRKKTLVEHSNTIYHKEAEKNAQNFKTVVIMAIAPDIRLQVSGKTRAFYLNIQRLHSIMKVILDLARQGLPLRGHRYETLTNYEMRVCRRNSQGDEIVLGDKNKGNFLHFIRARADAGDTRLGFANIADRKAAYLSPKVQNEILLLLSNQVSVVHKISQVSTRLVSRPIIF